MSGQLRLQAKFAVCTNVNVWIDGEFMDQLVEDMGMTFNLSAGEHRLAVQRVGMFGKKSKIMEITVTIREGEKVWYMTHNKHIFGGVDVYETYPNLR